MFKLLRCILFVDVLSEVKCNLTRRSWMFKNNAPHLQEGTSLGFFGTVMLRICAKENPWRFEVLLLLSMKRDAELGRFRLVSAYPGTISPWQYVFRLFEWCGFLLKADFSNKWRLLI